MTRHPSPNLYFFNVRDFEGLVRAQNWTVERESFPAGRRAGNFLANLMAEVAVFLMRK